MGKADREFELAYQTFMADGGFAQPCLNEGYEIMLRLPHDGTNVERCKHGLTLLTCSTCYLQLQKPS